MKMEQPINTKNLTLAPPICAGCKGEIKDQFMLRVSPDMEWHSKCLKCEICRQSLDENASTCYVKYGKTYCKKDYYNLFGVRCNGCGLPFTKSDLVMRAKHLIFHTHCFQCWTCHKLLLPGEQFTLKSPENWLFCTFHINAKSCGTTLFETISSADDNNMCSKTYYSSYNYDYLSNSCAQSNGYLDSISLYPNDKRGDLFWPQPISNNGVSDMTNGINNHNFWTVEHSSSLKLGSQPNTSLSSTACVDTFFETGGKNTDPTFEEITDTNLGKENTIRKTPSNDEPLKNYERKNEDEEFDIFQENNTTKLMSGGNISSATISTKTSTNYTSLLDLIPMAPPIPHSQLMDENTDKSKCNYMLTSHPSEYMYRQRNMMEPSIESLDNKHEFFVDPTVKRQKLEGVEDASFLIDDDDEDDITGPADEMMDDNSSDILSNNSSSIIYNNNNNSKNNLNISSNHQQPNGINQMNGHTSHPHNESNCNDLPSYSSAGPINSTPMSNYIRDHSNNNIRPQGNTAGLYRGGNHHPLFYHHHGNHHHPHRYHGNHHHGNGNSSNNNLDNNNNKVTRVRTVLNEKQLHTLRTCYNANPRPDALMKEQLVEMTGLSPRVIRVWFQNKRCKDKKRQILMKQISQAHEKGLTSLHGIPLIAHSPIHHELNANMPYHMEIQSFPLNSN